MAGKIKVGIVFGVKSAEHEVSLQSAKNVIDAIDKDKYDVVLLGIDQTGKWHMNEDTSFLLNANDPKHIELVHTDDEVALIPGENKNQLINISRHEKIDPIQVIFPILHGPFGEDGTIQGLLKLADIPFVGAGVLGSAVGMDKDVMKRLLRDGGIPIGDFLTFHRHEMDRIHFDAVQDRLGTPLFIKPANLGSSVGIRKVSGRAEFEAGVRYAFEYDHKILIEEFIDGREIECAVLGNENPMASLPGEILPQRDFYSYEAKYIDENGALLEIPAKLSDDDVKRIQEIAVKTYQVLCCEGMARVDVFLDKKNNVIINEINTIPGFTQISMYPKLWEISGISYTDLIDRLIQLAMDRFKKDKALKTVVEI